MMKKMFLLAILIATLSYNNFSQFKANIDTNFLFKKYSNKEDTVRILANFLATGLFIVNQTLLILSHIYQKTII